MSHMVRGASGRIVIEIDPLLKRAVHGRLASEGITMKDWFLRNVRQLLNRADSTVVFHEPEPALLDVAEPSVSKYARER
jgi:hypothetical protein